MGLSGDQLSVEAHVIVGDAPPLQSVVRVVRSAGAKVKGLVIEHLASSEAVITAEEREMGVVLVDVGGGTTDIAIFKDGAVWHTAVLPVGGYQFTTDIAVALGIPFAAAEAAKVRYGGALPDGVDSREMVDVQTSHEATTKPVQRLALHTLLHDRAVELIHLIMLTACQAGLDRMPPAGLVFTGGTANLPGLVELAAGYVDCPVRHGSPSEALGLPAELADSSFATSVGLLLWGIRNQRPMPLSNTITLSEPVAQRLTRWLSRFGVSHPREAQA